MRILVVGQTFWPSLGGAEVMLRRLAAEWVRQGHRVVAATTKLTNLPMSEPLPSEETIDGIRIVRLPFQQIRLIGTAIFVARLRHWIAARSADFDLIYVSMLKHAAFAALAACRRHGVPCVLRAEGAGATGDVAWLRKARFGTSIAARCMQADAVVAPSIAIREELLEFGFRQEQVHLLENAVSEAPAWSTELRSEARARLKIDDSPLVVYTGRLHRDKCIDDAILAVKLLRNQGTPLQFMIVGDGNEMQPLRELVDREKIGDAVHFIGRVSDVQPYLSAADAFVLPSRHEGLSVALLEALATGVPAIASEIDANRGILPPRMLPLVASGNRKALAGALEAVIHHRDNTSFRRQLQSFVAERFSLSELAARHVELFTRLTSKA